LRSKLQKQEIKTDDYIHSTDSSSSPYPQKPKRNKGITKFIRILEKKILQADHTPEESQHNHSHVAGQGQAQHQASL